IFDESGYLKIDPKRGHPYDDPSELFASGFTVMRHFPAEFIEKMQSLKKKDVRSYALALKAAASILEYAGKRHPQVIHSTLIDFLQTELRTRK
ncbi:MAG TPA: hypothetical protein VI875_01540, partial [Candidatus Norongarragalinales archaeon]|nr:hypothetical protein [Candidatus Norongarragalinales archaeon]